MLHQDFLAVRQADIRAAETAGDHVEVARLLAKESHVAWSDLRDGLKDSNRMLARRLHHHLTIPGAEPRTFAPVYQPDAPIDPRPPGWLTPADPIDVMAEREHDLWCADMRALGWRRGTGAESETDGPARKLNANIRPWAELGEGTRQYDRNIIRRLPFVFAKADYRLEQARPGRRPAV